MTEPVWLTAARAKLGTREITGSKHSATIMAWIKNLGPKVLGITVKDDETPWCGTFVAQCMDEVRLTPPPIAVRASSWGTWGRRLLGPRMGCILVFTRQGGGHVGFYVGETKTHYAVLGGNQGNAVTVTMIAKDRLSPGGMRWPYGPTLPPAKPVFVDAKGVPVSVNEA